MVFFKTVLLALLLAVVVVVTLVARKSAGLVVLYVIAIPLATVAGCLLTLALIAHAADVYHYVVNLSLDRKTRERRLREPTPIHANEMTGSYPVLLDDQTGRVLDVDRGLVFDANGLVSASPRVHDWAAKRRLIQSLTVNIGGGDVGGLLSEPEQNIEWPKLVDLRGQFADREPTLNDIVVGVYPDENGLQRLSASIHDLMHVLVIGVSGFGKSTWLRALLWQLARAREPMDVVAIDVSGSEFNPIRNWEKLRYPLAKEPKQAAALLDAASQEIARRKVLYEAHPLATKLTEYNRMADKPLSPWVILVDEGTSLLNDSNVGDNLRRGVQQARQYGLYYVLSGQSANHRVIETQTRDQFSTRLCFRTSPTSSRVVLDDGGASDIRAKGRALAQLVGREMQEVQGLYVTKDELVKALVDGGPRYPMPEANGNGHGDGDQERRIRELAAQGMSKRQICLDVFEYTGGAAFDAVSKILG